MIYVAKSTPLSTQQVELEIVEAAGDKQAPFFHWRKICETIDLSWKVFWIKEVTADWQTQVAAALTTYDGVYFVQSKLKPGYWSLLRDAPLEKVIQKDLLFNRKCLYILDPATGSLLRNENSVIELEKDSKYPAPVDDERESRRLKRQLKKMAASFVFSNLDSPQMQLSPDLMEVSHDSGYCTAKTTHGFSHGKWYFEVQILPFSTSTTNHGHVRIGVGQILAEAQAPIGYDEYGYCYRDRDGASVHCGVAEAYGEPYGPGDVIGVLLSLPSLEGEGSLNEALREPIEHLYPPLKLGKYQVRQEIWSGGSISFYRNGNCLGVAFQNLYRAKYYPAISIYGSGRARFDFSPKSVPEGAKPANEICSTTE